MARGGFGGTGGGGGAGLGGATTVSTALKTLLENGSGSYEWSAAVVSSNTASSLELGTDTSVMALGGYNGTDPAISLADFKKLVAEGKVHYFIGSGTSGFIGSTAANTSTAYAIQQWVASTFTARTVGTDTVYDLSS